MYTPTQLEVIRIFGKKDLSFGCWLFIQNPDWYAQYIEEIDAWNGFTIMSATYGYSVLNDKSDILKDWNIIGHIPHLEDVFRVAFDNGKSLEIWKSDEWYSLCFSQYKRILYNPDITLIEQSELTLQQLISLFK